MYLFKLTDSHGNKASAPAVLTHGEISIPMTRTKDARIKTSTNLLRTNTTPLRSITSPLNKTTTRATKHLLRTSTTLTKPLLLSSTSKVAADTTKIKQVKGTATNSNNMVVNSKAGKVGMAVLPNMVGRRITSKDHPKDRVNGVIRADININNIINPLTTVEIVGDLLAGTGRVRLRD
jgi:hypothetical protein